MFTIRHIEPDSGHESLTSCESVDYDSGDTISTQHPGIRGICAIGGGFRDQPDTGGQYQTGDVFVMNEAGATVAVYRRLGVIPDFDIDKFFAEFPNNEKAGDEPYRSYIISGHRMKVEQERKTRPS